MRSQAPIPVDKLNDLLRKRDQIRNIAIVGDRDHGKTSLVRALASRIGSEGRAREGEVAAEDSIEATRTLSVTPVVFTPPADSQDYLIHVVDTPGSLDDAMDIDAALAVADGVVLVVDPNDGVGLLAEKTVEQAVARRKKIVLLINKLDERPGRNACVAAVDAVNAIIRRACANDQLPICEWELNPKLGNIVFGSTQSGKGFTLARLAASMATKLSMEESDLFEKLWRSWFRDCETSHSEGGSSQPIGTSGRFFEETIAAAFTDDVDLLWNSEIPTRFDDDDDNSWILVEPSSSLAASVLGAIVRHVPSPIASLASLPQDEVNQECVDAIRNCDSNGPLVIRAVKLIPAPDTGELIAIGRVLSGKVTMNQDVSVITRSVSDDSFERRVFDGIEHHTARITGLRLASPGPLDVEGLEIPAGNICVLRGVDAKMYKSGIVTTCDPTRFRTSWFVRCTVDQAKPKTVLRVAIAPSHPEDSPKLLVAMQWALRTDLGSECYVNDSGEIILAVLTAHQLQRSLSCIKDHLQDDISYRVSDPFVSYQEAITSRTPHTILTKSPNKHIRLFCTAKPLKPALVREWSSPQHSILTTDQHRLRLAQVYGWSERDVARIIADPSRNCGPNVLVDQSIPLLHSFKLEDPMRRGLMFAASAGVLCEEPVVGMRINLVDTAMFGMERHWRPAQSLVAMRMATFACQLASSPALLEPVFLIEIRWRGCEVDASSLVNLVTDRRGSVVELDESRRKLRVRVPVEDSIDLDEALRHAVGKDTTSLWCQAVLDHYERVEGDPLDPASPAGIVVRDVRTRKHLDPDVPPLSRFHHQ